mmetsp:Transcript_32630/g.69986  ORF Transcript_32630/g.69986 Transcript_32630/m.69986 type:complete len:282 (-) Transcript_32630:510-1355(-)
MLRNTTSKPGGLGDLLADVEHGKLPLTAALAELEGNLQTLRAASPRTAKLPASSKASSIVAKMGAWQLAQKKQGEVSKLPPNRIPTRSSAPQRRTYSPVRDTRQYKGSPTGEITTTAAKTPTTTGDHENLGDTEVWLESTSASPANSGYPRDTYEGAEANRLRARVVAAAVARSRSPNDRSNIATKGRIEFPGREDEEDEDESSKKVLALQQALDKSSKKGRSPVSAGGRPHTGPSWARRPRVQLVRAPADEHAGAAGEGHFGLLQALFGPRSNFARGFVC